MNLISKVSKRIEIPGHTRRSISMHTAGIIYRSFILPVLDYRIPFGTVAVVRMLII